MNPKLFKPQPGIMPARGLLKWRDMIAAIVALKGAGQITVDRAKITETAHGVVVQSPINREAGSTPFDAVASKTQDEFQVSIVPGFVFGGVSFTVPEINDVSMLSQAATRISGAPKNIYIKINWRPVIALDAGTFVPPDPDPPYDITRYRCPQGIEIISSEIVWTDEDSPIDAGWSTGDQYVSAKIRETLQTTGDYAASVTRDGQHFERIATRNTEWRDGDSVTDLYLSTQEAVSGGYGNRIIKNALFLRDDPIETDPEETRITDIEFYLVVSGVSII